jgi:hypothetical protein
MESYDHIKPLFITPEEAAEELRIDPLKMMELIEEGKFPFIKGLDGILVIGRRRFISAAEDAGLFDESPFNNEGSSY